MAISNVSSRRSHVWRWARIALLSSLALLLAQLSLDSIEASDANRRSCGAIAGTAYLSGAERDWYWTYCLGRAAPTTPTASAATGGSVTQQFTDGYRKAGGPEHLLNHILYRVIPCESSYNPYAVNYVGPFYGLMQFYPPTWNRLGGGDWFSAWQQGYNTAKLIGQTSPGTQWPPCWYA